MTISKVVHENYWMSRKIMPCTPEDQSNGLSFHMCSLVAINHLQDDGNQSNVPVSHSRPHLWKTQKTSPCMFSNVQTVNPLLFLQIVYSLPNSWFNFATFIRFCDPGYIFSSIHILQFCDESGFFHLIVDRVKGLYWMHGRTCAKVHSTIFGVLTLLNFTVEFDVRTLWRTNLWVWCSTCDRNEQHQGFASKGWRCGVQKKKLSQRVRIRCRDPLI